MPQHFRFRIERPINVDAAVLVLCRCEWERDCPVQQVNAADKVTQSVLLADGTWHEYRGYDVLPMDLMPKMDGVQMLQEKYLMDRLDQFEQHVRTLVGMA